MLRHNPDGTIAVVIAPTPGNGLDKPAEILYKPAASGVCYHAQTPQAVVDALETARRLDQPVRLFYGDPKTGKDWLETSEIKGKLGSSMGPVKVPLLLVGPRAIGGSPLLDHCVVKLMAAKKIVYQHPDYHLGKIEQKPSAVAEFPYGVFRDGESQANFKTDKARQNYLALIKGEEPKRAPRREVGLAL